MHPDYSDITERIKEKPTWYSEGGFPRYGKPRPSEQSIYADESIAVVIGCQGCHEEFLVVYDEHKYDHKYVCIGGHIEGEPAWKKENLWKMEMIYCSLVADAEKGDPPHYGDPPRHNCVGDTMNSYAIRTVGWWRKQNAQEAHEQGIEHEYPPYEFTSCNWPGGPDWAKELIEG